ncbi:hypothetical protein ACFSKM_02935 [Ancylobacter dichloromethanicus]
MNTTKEMMKVQLPPKAAMTSAARWPNERAPSISASTFSVSMSFAARLSITSWSSRERSPRSARSVSAI